MSEGTTLPEAVQMLTRGAYQDGYKAAERELIPYLVQGLLMRLREELERHPYEAPGLHTAINLLSGRVAMTGEEWRDYLGSEDHALMQTMSWDHPGEVRWIPPLDEEEGTGSD